MKIYVDTEFDGWGGDLISMGMVAENGLEFYAELDVQIKDPWVHEHVVPLLEGPRLSWGQFQIDMETYIRRCGADITFVADWPDDIAWVCRALLTGPGRIMSSPRRLNFIIDRNLPDTSEHSATPHHALCDARALRP
jgi:hypothetical protein